MADSTITLDLSIDTTEAQQDIATLQNDIRQTVEVLNSRASSGNVFGNFENNISNIITSLGQLQTAYANVQTAQSNISSTDNRQEISNMVGDVEMYRRAVDSTRDAIQQFATVIQQVYPSASQTLEQGGIRSVQNKYIGSNKAIADLVTELQRFSGVVNLASSDGRKFEEELRNIQNACDAAAREARRIATESEWNQYSEEVRNVRRSFDDLLTAQQRMDDEWRYMAQNGPNALRDFDGNLRRVTSSTRQLQSAVAEVGTQFFAVNTIFRSVSTIVGELKKPVDALYNFMRRTFSKIWSIFKSTFSRMLSFGKSVFTALTSKMKQFASSFLKIGKSASSSSKGIDRANKSSQSFLATLLRSIVGFRSLYLFLRKFVNGVKEGLSNMAKFTRQANATTTALLTLEGKFTQLKNSAAAAVAPLITAVAPVLIKIADLFTRAANAVAQFFAALTGQKTYLKALTLGAESAADATKDLNKQLSGLDILNNMTTSKGGNDAGTNYMFDVQDVNDKFKKLADMVKALAKKLWEPIRKAWEKEGQGVIEAWKYALGEVYALMKSIGRDFLIMWNEDATVKMWQNIFKIIRNVGYTIGFLGRNLRDAWDYNNNGLKIWEDLRDIVAIVVSYLEQASGLVVDWAKQVNFKPLVTMFEMTLKSLIPVVDTIAGITYDAFKEVFMGFLDWLVEPGADKPFAGFQGVFLTIKRFADAIDLDKLRDNFSKLWKSLEPFMETVGEGLIKFFDRLLQRLADFINSDVVSSVFDKIAEFFDNITNNVGSDGVADFLEEIVDYALDLGDALLNLAESIMPLIKEGIQYLIDNKQKLIDFINNIADWIRENPDKIKEVITTIKDGLTQIIEFLGKVAAFLLEHSDWVVNAIKMTIALKVAFTLLGGAISVVGSILSVLYAVRILNAIKGFRTLATEGTASANTIGGTFKQVFSPSSYKSLFGTMSSTFKTCMGQMKLEGAKGATAIWQSLKTATNFSTMSSASLGGTIGLTLASGIVSAIAGYGLSNKIMQLFPSQKELYEQYEGFAGFGKLVTDSIDAVQDLHEMRQEKRLAKSRAATNAFTEEAVSDAERLRNQVMRVGASTDETFAKIQADYNNGKMSAIDFRASVEGIIEKSKIYNQMTDETKKSIQTAFDAATLQEFVDYYSQLETKVVDTSNKSVAGTQQQTTSVQNLNNAKSNSQSVTQATADAEKALVDAYASGNELMKESSMTYAEYESKLSELQTQLDDGTLVYDDYITKVTELSEAFTAGTEGFDIMTEDIGFLWEKTDEGITSIDELKQSFTNILSPLDDLNNSMSGSGGLISTFQQFSDTITGDSGVKSSMDNLSTSTEGVGKKMTDTLATEITSGTSTVKTSVVGLTDAVKNTFETALQISGGTSVVAQNWGVSLGNGIANGLNSTTATVRTVMTNFASIVSSAMRSAINSVNSAINNMTSSLNTFGNRLNNYQINTVSQRGTTRFSVPHLASGSVVPPNREFLAVLGDNKTETEVVSPLSTIKQAMSEVVANMNTTSDSGDIVVQIDGAEVFRAVRNQSNMYKKRTGSPAFS